MPGSHQVLNQLIDLCAVQAGLDLFDNHNSGGDGALLAVDAQGLDVRHTGEGNHRIEVPVRFRVHAIDLSFDLFLQQEGSVSHQVAQLDEVLDAQVGDGVGVRLAARFIPAENGLPV